MFDFLKGRKKQVASFNPLQEIQKLAELSPPSALLAVIRDKNSEPEDIGKSFFLRREKKLYSEGGNLYLTTPDNLKIAKDQNLTNSNVVLQFMNRRIPYHLECKIVGRYRLLPEVVETLDFNAKAAYKLLPVGGLKKEDLRQFYRYTLKNYGDSRIPITTHIGFELFIRNTNQEFPDEGAPPVLLKDVELIDLATEAQQQPFATRDAINQFRAIMLKQQPHDRSVFVSKIDKDDSTSLVRRKDEELLLGEINILGLEMESLRDVLYLKKSAKSGIRKGKQNPYNLNEGDRVVSNFIHDKKYYQMLIEIMEARTQNEVVRPIDFPREEEGLHVDVVDYSVGGALIESSPELLKFLLGDKCPANVDEEAEFEAEFWSNAFIDLQKIMIHLTFYPKMHFPDAVKRFQPELPFKIRVIAQVVRTHMHQIADRKILHHGLQFCYEPQGIPLLKDESIEWRYSRHIRDNEYFKTAHSQLSQLYGYLENQSMASSGGSARQREK
jgi:hypothetical protein